MLVTHGFLRSLAKLELEESAVGRFAADGGPPAPAAGEGTERWDEQDAADSGTPALPVTVGDTPWGVVGGLAAVVAAGALLAVLRRR